MKVKVPAILLIAGLLALAVRASWSDEAVATRDALPASWRAAAHEEIQSLLDPKMSAGGMFRTSDPMATTRRSIKCDLRMIDGISLRRLADCDSATLISVMTHPEASLVEFKINPDDVKISDGTRAELRDLYEAVNGEETWYRFSAALPTDFPTNVSESIVLAQWHEHARDDGYSLRPPLAHRLVNGEFVVSLWNTKIYDASMGAGDGAFIYRDPKFQLGAFNEYVYRINWFPDERGHVTAWKRRGCVITQVCGSKAWQKFVDYAGPVGYSDVKGYYFKFGLYTVHQFSKPFVAYDTGYMRGPTAGAVGVDRELLGAL